MTKFLTISELSIALNLIDPSSKKPLNHILRYWEKEFKFIKPKKSNNTRYYNEDQVEKLKLIKFLLRNKGMTISGVKNLLNSQRKKLDVNDSDSLKTVYLKEKFENKSKLILEKINKLKRYGKKNTSKS